MLNFQGVLQNSAGKKMSNTISYCRTNVFLKKNISRLEHQKVKGTWKVGPLGDSCSPHLGKKKHVYKHNVYIIYNSITSCNPMALTSWPCWPSQYFQVPGPRPVASAKNLAWRPATGWDHGGGDTQGPQGSKKPTHSKTTAFSINMSW